MKISVLKLLNQARMKRKPAAVITRITDGKQSLFVDNKIVAGAKVEKPFKTQIESALMKDVSISIGKAEDRIFINVFNPPKRLILIGAVHISQALAPMAQTVGYDVSIIDPRSSFATSERFPNIDLICKWPDEALVNLDIDRRTAVVTLTHDPKIDDPALASALNSSAFFIGSLGSQKTHGSRLERLQASGFNKDELDRINGPVGLNIQATSPSEIAVSILAQIIKFSRMPSGDEET